MECSRLRDPNEERGETVACVQPERGVGGEAAGGLEMKPHLHPEAASLSLAPGEHLGFPRSRGSDAVLIAQDPWTRGLWVLPLPCSRL